MLAGGARPLQDEATLPAALAFATQGSLQALASTCRYWLEAAYRLAPERWCELDVGGWPFAARELAAEARRAQAREEVMRRRQQRQQGPSATGPEPATEMEGFATELDWGEVDFATELKLKLFDFDGWDLSDPSAGGKIRPLVPRRKTAAFSDAGLWAAVHRLLALRSLTACSAKVTAPGIARALRHDACRSLVRLCLGGSVEATPELQGALEACGSLRELELHGISLRPPECIVDLRMDGGCDWHAVLPAVAKCGQLQVLALDAGDGGRFPVLLLLRVFAVCLELREINVYCMAVRACNAMLLTLLEHNKHLECFCACRAADISANLSLLQALGRTDDLGPYSEAALPMWVSALGRRFLARALTDEAEEAFRGAFPAAHIFIDDVEREFMEEADEDFDF